MMSCTSLGFSSSSLLLLLWLAIMARDPGETDALDDGDTDALDDGDGDDMLLKSESASVADPLLSSSSIMSTSPTRVEPSLKSTRLLWARRQFCLSSSRMASMAEQILRAGPSLMLMADIRWSAFKSIRAWPSISWS